MQIQQNLLSMAEVCKRTSLSRTAIFKHRSNKTFPTPVQISEVRIAFVESEIDQWITDRIANREIAA